MSPMTGSSPMRIWVPGMRSALSSRSLTTRTRDSDDAMTHITGTTYCSSPPSMPLFAALLTVAHVAALAVDSTIVIRVNQVGYLPEAPKVAVVCALDSTTVMRITRNFVLRDERGRAVFGPRRATPGGAF